jgi:predicted O-linked N-acetylglucosamine transferase (SPINDLY family)
MQKLDVWETSSQRPLHEYAGRCRQSYRSKTRSAARDDAQTRRGRALFSAAPKRESIDAAYRATADRFLELADDLDAARRTIEEAALDALIYTDLSMHPLTCFLALWRLAPVQMVAWGHPTTSGIDTIDYYLSAEALETGESIGSHSEKVLALPAFCGPGYTRPGLGSTRESRELLGLPAAEPLFLSVQAAQKFHPNLTPRWLGSSRETRGRRSR